MKENARIQAAIDIIAAVLESTHIPADTLITHYFRERRYIGSSDRRVIAELAYNVIRRIPALPMLPGSTAARHYVISYLFFYQGYTPQQLASLFNGQNYAPAPLTKAESTLLTLELNGQDPHVKHAVPAWIMRHLPPMPEAFWQSLNEPAPFDVRINPLLTTREAVLHTFYKDEIEAIPTPWSPWGVRLQGRRPLANHPLFTSGAIEVQDEGSQLLGLLFHAKPGEQVLDYCAGAGGKSLVLAATMANKGQLILSDTVEHRLRRARERLKRAHIHNYTVRSVTDPWFKRQEGRFDCVLVDAPCSGTGTWRRNPDLKIRFTEKDLAEVTAKQQEILSKAAAYVKPGGRLIYATCSLLPAENDAQIATFLQNHPHFSQQPIKGMWEQLVPIPYPSATPLTLNLYPHIHYTDGFFVGMMTRQK